MERTQTVGAAFETWEAALPPFSRCLSLELAMAKMLRSKTAQLHGKLQFSLPGPVESLHADPEREENLVWARR